MKKRDKIARVHLCQTGNKNKKGLQAENLQPFDLYGGP
jgi:hypothetical protein